MVNLSSLCGTITIRLTVRHLGCLFMTLAELFLLPCVHPACTPFVECVLHWDDSLTLAPGVARQDACQYCGLQIRSSRARNAHRCLQKQVCWIQPLLAGSSGRPLACSTRLRLCSR